MLSSVSTRGGSSKKLATAGLILLVLGLAALVALSSQKPSSWPNSRKVAVSEKNSDGKYASSPSQQLLQDTEFLDGEEKSNQDLSFDEEDGEYENDDEEKAAADTSAARCRRLRVTTLRGYPTVPLGEFINVAAAAYKSAPADYLENHSDNNWKGCGRKHKGGFRAVCLLDDTNKRMYIAFRGLTPAQLSGCAANGALCMAGFLITANSVMGDFRTWLNKKRKQNSDYEEFALVGHSYGAYFATRLRQKKTVWHITFNGYKAKRGKYTINMRKPGSDLAVDFSKKCNYFIVGRVKGHEISSWLAVKNRAWSGIIGHGKTAIDLP